MAGPWEQFQVTVSGPWQKFQKPELPPEDERITALREPGAAERILRGVPGLGGALDEIGAAADSAIGYVTGGASGEDYDTALERRRQAIRKSDTENPIRNTAEQFAGAAVSAAALPFARVFTRAAPTSTIAAGGDAAINAAAYSAPHLFADAEGGFQNRVENVRENLPTAAGLGLVAGAAGQRLANRYAGTPRNSVVRQADQIGVELPAFMEGNRATQNIASKMGAIPFVGDDINAAVVRSRNQAGEVVERLSYQTAGANVMPRDAGEAVRDSMRGFTGPRARAAQDRVYGPVNQAMAGVQAPMTNTRQAAAELVRQQNESASPLHAVALREIEDALGQPNGLSFEGLTRLRSRIGNIRDDKLIPGNRTANAGLSSIYGALTRDMETAIAQQGGMRAQAAWQRANAVTRQIAQRRDAVAKIIGAQGDRAGEGIVDRLITLAGTRSGADAALLGQARRAAGAEAWRQFAGNAIPRLARNQSNLFSPDIFLKNYSQLSHEGRRILFGSTGDNNLMRELDALADVAGRLQQFSRLGNPSGSGGVGALLAALGGAASGDMGVTAATAVGGRGLGYLLSQPAVVRQATQHARNMAAFLNGRQSRAAVAASAANLARVVAKETGEDVQEVTARIMAVTPQVSKPD